MKQEEAAEKPIHFLFSVIRIGPFNAQSVGKGMCFHCVLVQSDALQKEQIRMSPEITLFSMKALHIYVVQF